MDEKEFINQLMSGDPLAIAIVAVGFLIVIASIVSLVISIVLAISYVKYNKMKNSIAMTGEKIARKILDDHDLQKIKVKCTGSILFGNSYSHYFKKVRLRRRTWKKDSVASLAMATQKSSLAILDKEGDPDMKRRIRLVPITTFGPLALIPLIIVGVILDIIFFNTVGVVTALCTGLGILFYVLSFVLSMTTLVTEKKAQAKAIEIARADHLATEDEIVMMQKLFRLYNIEYVNDMILALLELIYNVLKLIMALRGDSSSSSND